MGDEGKGNGLKVLLVCSSRVYGGAERSLLEGMKALGGSGVEFLVALPDGSPLFGRFEGVATCVEAELDPAVYSKNPFRIWKSLRRLVRANRALAALIRREGIDVVHANSFKALLCAGLAARWTGRACICHVRDNLVYGWQQWVLGRYAGRVVAISNYIALQLKLAEGQVRVVYNCIHAEGHKMGRTEDWRGRLGVPSDGMLIAQVGQMVDWKRHGDFVRVLAEVGKSRADVHGVIAGGDVEGGRGEYAQALLEQGRLLGLEGRLHVLGFQDDLDGLWSEVDVLLHLAEGEPFGRVVAEAMWAGVAVVAVDAGGPRELIRDGENGILVGQGDLGGAVAATLRLLGDEGERERLGMAAADSVRARFTGVAYREAMLDLYREAGSGK